MSSTRACFLKTRNASVLTLGIFRVGIVGRFHLIKTFEDSSWTQLVLQALELRRYPVLAVVEAVVDADAIEILDPVGNNRCLAQ